MTETLHMKPKIALVCVGLLILAACKNTEGWETTYDTGLTYPDLEPRARGDLLYMEEVTTLSAEQVIHNIPERDEFDRSIPGFDIHAYVKYGITIYRVYYSSTFEQSDIVLSGLVMVPDVEGALPQFQYHHGTTFPIEGLGALDVPSLYSGGGPTAQQDQFETRVLAAIPAASGYVVSAPDYAGYSISKDVEHPYVFHDELAQSSLDMLVATQQLANQLDVPLTEHVFLGGWSEGGGTTLALHRLIEEGGAHNLAVTASAPFAGPYHYSRFMSAIIGSDAATENMSIYNWSLYVLNKYAETPMAPGEIWTYPVDNQVDAINVPSEKVPEVIKSSFIVSMKSGNTPLNSMANANNLHDNWHPVGNIYFHSGTGDDIVPHYNSEDAYTALKAQATGEVKLYTYEGDHYTPVTQYLINMINDFNSLR